MEADYSNEDISESEQDDSSCRECEIYQQKIYEVNARLRTTLTESEYQETKSALDDLVQA